jgi:hypothetical protein
MPKPPYAISTAIPISIPIGSHLDDVPKMLIMPLGFAGPFQIGETP